VIYYYKVIAIDSAATPASVTTSQLVVTTTALANQALNQFAMAPVLGQLDQMFNGDTLEVRYDPAGSGNLVAGQAVYWSTVANGTPMVLPSTATSDVVAGFVNFSIKDQSFAPGANLEISMRGNVMYLLAALAINRGQEVTSLPAGVAGGVVGGVIPAVGSGGLPKVGFALDTVSQGNLVRIFLSSPGYIVS
jgi:hypothetical protein